MTVAVLFVVALGVIFGGFYDVGAGRGHFAAMRWALRTTTINSVRGHADEVAISADVPLQDRAFAEHAAGHYAEMCQVCHGGPGIEPEHWVEMYPPPPRLAQPETLHASWSDREIFWIIKHGIKDTGMSAFGAHEEDRELWALTAFVRRLPAMSREEYRTLVQTNPAPEETEEASRAGEAAD